MWWWSDIVMWDEGRRNKDKGVRSEGVMVKDEGVSMKGWAFLTSSVPAVTASPFNGFATCTLCWKGGCMEWEKKRGDQRMRTRMSKSNIWASVIEIVKKGSSQVCSVSSAFSLIHVSWLHTQLSLQLLLLASKGKRGQVHHTQWRSWMFRTRLGTTPVQCHGC